MKPEGLVRCNMPPHSGSGGGLRVELPERKTPRG
jgi:hypothetical protein